jgi:hypothetical protein
MSAPMAPNSHAAQVAAWLLANFSEVASPAASANTSGVYNVTAAESNSFGRACGGNNQYAISLSWNEPTTDGGPKRKLVMMAGIHAAGEHKSWIGFLAALQWMLLDESSEAQAFRANWDVWLYFNVTPNGVVAGDTRTNPSRSTDPNRDFSISGTSALAEINALRAAIVSDTGGSADAVIGWHGADARSTRFNLFLVPDDYAAGTRSSAIQEFMDAGTTIFGVAPSLIKSDAGGTHAKWGAAVLGAKISLAAEMQGKGDNTLEEAQFIGQSWVKTLQAVDAAGEFWSPTGAAFSGAAQASALASGLLGASEVPLAGAAILTGTAAGSLTTAVQMAAQALAGGQAVGDLSTAIQLGGAAVSAVVSAGELTAQIRLDGAALAAALASGALSTGDGLEGAATGSALASGGITTLIVLRGAAVGAALAAAELSTAPSGLAGDATAGAAAAGALTTAIPLLGGAQVSVIAAGAVHTTVSLAGAAVAVVAVSGDLVVALELSADAVAAAVAGADLTTQIVMRADAVVGAQASGALGGIALLAPPPSYRIVRTRAENRILRAR